MPYSGRLLVVGLAVLLAQAAAPPQQTPSAPQASQTRPPSSSQQPQPRFRTETNLVRVDVYATKDGQPVQDMKAEDFELYEDDAPQKIDSFEHIVVTPAGPQDALVEPNNVEAANQLAADPKRRVFVIYLDAQHSTVSDSHDIRGPLIDLLQRVMGDDDLVGIMTPTMSPSQITFGRRTRVIEEGLTRNWAWGRRDTLLLDERERLYDACYPPVAGETQSPSAKAQEMIDRRRERIVMDSLEDLVRHMAAIREGRTAVITVSDGWVLFGPNESLTTVRSGPRGGNADPIPGAPPPVGVGSGGTLTARPQGGLMELGGGSDRTECEKDQMELAMMDDQVRFRGIFGEANRANVSFYTIDPRGLAPFDSSIGPTPPPPPSVDRQNLMMRQDALRALAVNTDGLALLANNDLKKLLRRVSDDLTSYYLMGYYSTNSKLDGKFRSIKVRSKRPGVEIRSRRGYTAATADEVARARAAADAPVPDATVAIGKALAYIETDVRAQGRHTVRGEGEPLIFHRGPSTGNQLESAPGRVFPRSDRLRLELEAAAGSAAWTGALLDRKGDKTIVPVTTGDRTDAATGQRWLTADLTLAPLGPGDYVVELTTAQGGEQHRTLVGIRVTR